MDAFIVWFICGIGVGMFVMFLFDKQAALITFLVMVFIGMVLFLLSTMANAEEQPLRLEGVGLHIASHHFPAQEYNNVNPGVYVIAHYNGPGFFTGEYVLGTYYNSERNQSVYIARNLPLYSHVDLAVGAITGYHRASVLPLVAPSIWVGLGDGFRARLLVMPKVERDGSWAIHLAVERRF